MVYNHYMGHVSINGMDEVISAVDALIQKYPDRTGDFLEKKSKETRKEIADEAKSSFNVDTSDKFSLGRVGRYKVVGPIGQGCNQQVLLYATSPHFHLLENGHELKSHSGRSIGWVQGYMFLDAVAKRQKIKIPKEFEEEARKVLKEENFL